MKSKEKKKKRKKSNWNWNKTIYVIGGGLLLIDLIAGLDSLALLVAGLVFVGVGIIMNIIAFIMERDVW